MSKSRNDSSWKGRKLKNRKCNVVSLETVWTRLFNLDLFREIQSSVHARIDRIELIYVQLIIVTKFQIRFLFSHIWMQTKTLRNTMHVSTCCRNPRERVSWYGGGRPLFPRIRILQKFVFRSSGARSSVGQTKFRWPTCVYRMVLSLYFRPGIRGHRYNVRRWSRLKLLYAFGELGVVPDWLRAREKGEVKRGGLFGETRFLLVKNDSQWEIRNVKILIPRDL